ncbi:hypothetical protein Plec18167_000163 [Paecilomyces lecythidis]|uniref:Zn(2)-C6 fungal-type domain-containing protein n=1 Tax=Paecilomyces lecythidis TaxID=3004212 RepID=A0ABR3YFL6_9EURO
MDPSLVPPPVSELRQNVPRRRFAATGRVRSGCLTCKARKKKCDERYTSDGSRCQTCARLSLVCERVPLRKVVPKKPSDGPSPSPSPSLSLSLSPSSSNSGGDDQANGVSSPSNTRINPNGFITLFSLENASPERILLKYYIERLASLCSILQEGSNEFRNVLLPMAIDDTSLLYALFAYASVHLHTSAPAPQISPLTKLKFQTEAARGLSEAIRLNNVSESTIACALICSTAEAVSGDTTRWFIHLQGAGHLLDQQGGPERLRRTSDGLFLLRNFAYHDILAALSTGGRPRFGGVYWVEDGPISADCLMGVAHELLSHISEICFFIADANDSEVSTDVFPEGLLTRGETLAQKLKTQTLNLRTTLTSTELGILLHHAEAFRYAGLLHLYRFLRRFSGATYGHRIAECVEGIIAHVSQVPLSFHCEVGLVFPLFMAGIADVDEGTKAYVRNRLDNIYSWTKFEHITRIKEVLEALWSAGRTDWENLLRDLEWKISMA